MTSGFRSYFFRKPVITAHCDAPSSYGFHCRGLDENTCSALHPSRYARSAAFSTPPAVDVCIPIRLDVSLGAVFGGGISFRMSFSKEAIKAAVRSQLSGVIQFSPIQE